MENQNINCGKTETNESCQRRTGITLRDSNQTNNCEHWWEDTHKFDQIVDSFKDIRPPFLEIDPQIILLAIAKVSVQQTIDIIEMNLKDYTVEPYDFTI